MADVSVALEWEGTGLVFRGGPVDGFELRVDGNTKVAVSPVQLMLVSLVACSAADVVDILSKMRVPLKGLTVRAQGDRAPSAPRRYTAIRLVYEARGVAAEAEEKLHRAVQLSHEKYCSVMHSLRPDIEIHSDVVRQ
ncbi:MAG: OsmC family protein [Longimicrobiales bacterium]